jgi:hypothetical protein
MSIFGLDRSRFACRYYGQQDRKQEGRGHRARLPVVSYRRCHWGLGVPRRWSSPSKWAHLVRPFRGGSRRGGFIDCLSCIPGTPKSLVMPVEQIIRTPPLVCGDPDSSFGLDPEIVTERSRRRFIASGNLAHRRLRRKGELSPTIKKAW